MSYYPGIVYLLWYYMYSWYMVYLMVYILVIVVISFCGSVVLFYLHAILFMYYMQLKNKQIKLSKYNVFLTKLVPETRIEFLIFQLVT